MKKFLGLSLILTLFLMVPSKTLANTIYYATDARLVGDEVEIGAGGMISGFDDPDTQWIEFDITVPSADEYTIELSYVTPMDNASLLINDTIVETPPAGDWGMNPGTIEFTIVLEEGDNTIVIKRQSDYSQVNYLRVFDGTGEDEIKEPDFDHGKWLGQLNNNKATYQVGETVSFSLMLNHEKDFDGKDIIVKYKHLSDTLEEVQLDITDHELTWDWTPPEEDFTGYMVEVYLEDQEEVIDQLNIAVDVSSEWTKFPRYGYLSDYGDMSEEEQLAIIERLNRFHINSLQFYDWKDLHHIPAQVVDGELASSWMDIANRYVSRTTVENYISLAHEKNMKAMHYNLIFGANENYQDDGVKEEWGLFTSPSLEQQDNHPLPDTWKSSIYLMNPVNREWQDYIIASHRQMFEHLDFDGWHGDQLGYRGTLWDWDENEIEIYQTYEPFMNYAKEELGVYMGLNAVSMYGAKEIAEASVDYAYVEVWDQTKYQDLKDIIDFHGEISDGELSTVLAAYMNYELAGKGVSAEFNTPGVLFTDAVIFAAGGNHIELGENMLAREYFPDKTLSIPDELEHRLIRYYDFAVAYQNLLRDDLVAIEREVSSEDVIIRDNPMLSAVWNFTKQKENKDIHHFINFTNAISLDWKDEMGTQTAPHLREDLQVSIISDQRAEKVWFATPDNEEGSAIELAFTQENDEIIFELPSLEYWSMVVVEYTENDDDQESKGDLEIKLEELIKRIEELEELEGNITSHEQELVRLRADLETLEVSNDQLQALVNSLLARIEQLENQLDKKDEQAENDNEESVERETGNGKDGNQENTKSDDSKLPTEEQNTNAVDVVKSNDETAETAKLPNTATTVYRYLFIGILILIAGCSLALYNHRRTNLSKH